MKLSAKLLIERNAKATIRNKYGTTALHFAARRGNADLCKLLLDKPNVDINATDNGLVSVLAILPQTETLPTVRLEKMLFFFVMLR